MGFDPAIRCSWTKCPTCAESGRSFGPVSLHLARGLCRSRPHLVPTTLAAFSFHEFTWEASGGRGKLICPLLETSDADPEYLEQDEHGGRDQTKQEKGLDQYG